MAFGLPWLILYGKFGLPRRGRHLRIISGCAQQYPVSEQDVTLASLHHMAQREIEEDGIRELEPGTLGRIAGFIEGVRSGEYGQAGNGVRDSMAAMAADLADLLVNTRISKARSGAPRANLTDEERYVFEMSESSQERLDEVLSAVAQGRPGLLDSLAERHRARTVTVRFLSDVDEFVGSDADAYGPFKAEDVATVPYNNAEALVASGSAARVRAR